MADFLKMVPFIFHFAAGVPRSASKLTLEEQFEIARKRGWSDDPHDPGGATMVDVTYSTFCTHRMSRGLPCPSENDLREITFAEWREILKTDFWDFFKADLIDGQGLANLCVDWLWASGPMAVRRVQSIAGVKADGVVGPKTLKALNGPRSGELFKQIRRTREDHYRSCRGAWKYLSGWLRRLDAIASDGSFRY